jgi:hypothetical protein
MGGGSCEKLPSKYDQYIEYIQGQATLNMQDVGEYDQAQLYTVLYGPLGENEYYEFNDLNNDGKKEFYKATTDAEGNQQIITVYGRDDKFQKTETSYDDWLELDKGVDKDPTDSLGTSCEGGSIPVFVVGDPGVSPGNELAGDRRFAGCYSPDESWIKPFLDNTGKFATLPADDPAIGNLIDPEDKEDQGFADYVKEVGEGVANTAKGLYDELEDKITGCVGSPLDCIKQIGTAILDAGGIPPECQDMNDPWFCTDTPPDAGGKTCWKDCVNFNLPGLPIPNIPMPPGVVDVGTYRDFETAVKTVGKTIGDIIEGNAKCGENDDQECTVGQVLEDAGTWVMKKIEGVLKDIDDATLDDAYGWIKDVFGTVIGGYIFTQVEEKIDDVLFGVAPPEGEDENCIEREYYEANQQKCLDLGYIDCDSADGGDGKELTGGIIGPNKTINDCSEIQDPRCIRDGVWNGEKCVCPDGTDKAEQDEPFDGDCSDEFTKTPQEICEDKGLTYDPSAPEADRDEDDCVSGTTDGDGDDDDTTTTETGIICEEGVALNPSNTYSQRKTAWDEVCGQTHCFQGVGQAATKITDHVDNNCSNPLKTDVDDTGECPEGTVACPEGTFNINDGSSCSSNPEVECKKRGDDTPKPPPVDGYDCKGNPQTFEEEEACIDQGWAQCGSNTQNPGRWYPSSVGEAKACGTTVTPPPPEECDNGATVESGCDICPDGSSVLEHENGKCPPVKPPPPPPMKCNDPNAVNNGEDGPCECKPGYSKSTEGLCVQKICDNGAIVESGCDTCPDGSSVLEHENGECPTVKPPPEKCDNGATDFPACTTCPEGQSMDEDGNCKSTCTDCSCAEYAAANPDECVTDGDGGGDDGGGDDGGGGGGGGGMFRPQASAPPSLGDPQLLARTEFPIVDYLSESLAQQTKGELMQGMLTGNIV